MLKLLQCFPTRSSEIWLLSSLGASDQMPLHSGPSPFLYHFSTTDALGLGQVPRGAAISVPEEGMAA